MNYPVLSQKHHAEPSIFTAGNMLREARRQKGIVEEGIPSVCVLDPDGDIVQHLIATGQASADPRWACYHTKLYRFVRDGLEYGIVPHAVGAPFAVLLAEELFACGCQLLVSITSAGQITPVGAPPYFVLIERALRDEGTSYHYLPPSDYSDLGATVRSRLQSALIVDRDRLVYAFCKATHGLPTHRSVRRKPPSPLRANRTFSVWRWRLRRFMLMRKHPAMPLCALPTLQTRWHKSRVTLRKGKRKAVSMRFGSLRGQLVQSNKTISRCRVMGISLTSDLMTRAKIAKI
jgi:hypothetical protein